MPTHYSRIIAAVDGSEHAGRAAAAAAGLARDMNRPLTLLFVLPAPAAHEFMSMDSVQGALHASEMSDPRALEEEQRKAGERAFAAARAAIGGGVEIEERVSHGPVVPEILRVAKELQPALLVVGRRGLGSLQEFVLGSVSNKLVHQGAVPVLVV